MSKFRYEVTNTKESVPENTVGTGSIDTFGLAIVGTGTAFLTELIAGSWLVDLTQDECRRVVRVDSDTQAYLEKPFSTDLVAINLAVTPSIISKWKASPKEISLKIRPTDADGELDGEVFSGVLTLSKSNADHSGRFDLIDPVIVDAAGTSIYISVLY